MINDNNTILIVEDDPELLNLNRKKLIRSGYNVVCATSIKQARNELKKHLFSIIILDVMLPDGSGFDFCKEVKRNNDVAVLFLTGKVQIDDKITGLDGGGDYYLVKPCDPNELLAVVSSLLRRIKTSSVLRIGKLCLHIEKMAATVDNKDLLLTPKEFTLLYVLAKNHNTHLKADVLSEKCWPNSEAIYSTNLLWAQLSRLRKKLENEGLFYINNVRNKGYILIVQ